MTTFLVTARFSKYGEAATKIYEVEADSGDEASVAAHDLALADGDYGETFEGRDIINVTPKEPPLPPPAPVYVEPIL